MDVLSIIFLPGCPAAAAEPLQVEVPLLLRREQIVRRAEDVGVCLEIREEAFGFCSLPDLDTIRFLSQLFDDTQVGRDYSSLRLTDDRVRQRQIEAIGLPPTCSADAATLALEWREPMRFIGASLFRRLCATRSLEGRPSVASLIHRFLDQHPSRDQQTDQSTMQPSGCILLNFALLPPRDAWRDALMALPWEALFEPDHLAPLEVEYQIVIARCVDPRPQRLPAPFSREQPVPTLTVMPQGGASHRENLDDAEKQALPYRPDRHGDRLVWCDCPPPSLGSTSEALLAQLEQHRPVLLHYFGHGSFHDSDSRDPASNLLVDGPSLHATQLASYLRVPPLWLFSCFACHSGTAGDLRGLPLSSSRWSLVNALGDQIPVMLMMTVKIATTAAGVAGEAWYEALSAGRTVLYAARSMRVALWRHTQSRLSLGHDYWDPNIHAWWIPALYLRHPRWDSALVDNEQRLRLLMPEGEFKRPTTRQEDTIARVLDRFSRGRARVVVIHGEQDQASRTTLLHQIARLHPARHILLSAKVPQGQTARGRLTTLRQAITACLRQARGLHVHWSSLAAVSEEEQRLRYGEELAAPRDEAFWVLIDDIDRLTSTDNLEDADLGLELLRPLERADPWVRFIVTTRTPLFDRLLTAAMRDPELCELEPIKPLYQQPQPYTHDYDRLVAHLANQDLKQRILDLLIGLGVPVTRATVARYCEDAVAGSEFDVDSALTSLAQDGLLAQRPPDELYRLVIEQRVLQRWGEDPTKVRMRTNIQTWCNQWYEASLRLALPRVRNTATAIGLPEDLLRLILSQKDELYEIRPRAAAYEIVDHNFVDQLGSNTIPTPYHWWLLMLKLAVHYGHQDLMTAYIKRRLADGTPYTPADQGVLNLILGWLTGDEDISDRVARMLELLDVSASACPSASISYVPPRVDRGLSLRLRSGSSLEFGRPTG